MAQARARLQYENDLEIFFSLSLSPFEWKRKKERKDTKNWCFKQLSQHNNHCAIHSISDNRFLLNVSFRSLFTNQAEDVFTSVTIHLIVPTVVCFVIVWILCHRTAVKKKIVILPKNVIMCSNNNYFSIRIDVIIDGKPLQFITGVQIKVYIMIITFWCRKSECLELNRV